MALRGGLSELSIAFGPGYGIHYAIEDRQDPDPDGRWRQINLGARHALIGGKMVKVPSAPSGENHTLGTRVRDNRERPGLEESGHETG